MKRLLKQLLFLVLLYSPAMANSPEAIHEAQTNLDRLGIDFDRDYGLKENRVEVRQLMEALIVAIDRTVPRLSPKEREWVETESKKSGPTAQRVLESPEHAIKELNDWTDECLGGLKDIKYRQESEDPDNFELAAWIRLRECAYFDDVYENVYQAELPNVRDLSVYLYLAQLSFQRWAFDIVLRDYLSGLMGWDFFSPEL